MEKKAPQLKPYHFKPGQSGNPAGKPKGLLTRDQVEKLLATLWGLGTDGLQKVIENPKSTVGEVMTARVMAKCIEDGDYSRLDFLLNRTIGKVKDQLEVSTVKPFVVENLDGTQTVMGISDGKEHE